MRSKATHLGLRAFGAAAAVSCSLLLRPAHAGTYAELTNVDPVSSTLTILLSDGSVLFHTGGTQDAILHPDASGNYVDGTWTFANPNQHNVMLRVGWLVGASD